MFIENATKNFGFVSCSWSVVSCGTGGRRPSVGRTAGSETRPNEELFVVGRGEETFGARTATTLRVPETRRTVSYRSSSDGERPTSHGSASGTGDRAGARGLRTGVPSEPRTEPCVVIGLSRGPHSSGDRTAPSGAIQTVQLQDSPARGAISGCGKCTVGLLAHASG